MLGQWRQENQGSKASLCSLGYRKPNGKKQTVLGRWLWHSGKAPLRPACFWAAVASNTSMPLSRLRVLCPLRPPDARRAGVSSLWLFLASQSPRALDTGQWGHAGLLLHSGEQPTVPSAAHSCVWAQSEALPYSCCWPLSRFPAFLLRWFFSCQLQTHRWHRELCGCIVRQGGVQVPHSLSCIPGCWANSCGHILNCPLPLWGTTGLFQWTLSSHY